MGGSAKRYGLEAQGNLELEVRLRGIETALANLSQVNQGTDTYSAARSDSIPSITGLKVIGQLPGSVTIAWDATPIPDLRRYEVVFAEDYSFTDNAQSFDTGTNSYQFSTASITGGAGGTVFYGRVRAENSIGSQSAWSTVLTMVTGQVQAGDIEDGAVGPAALDEDAIIAIIVENEGLTGAIAGLRLSRASVTSITVSQGSTSRWWEQVAAAGITKTTATWVAGTGNGGVASGVSIVNDAWYDVFLIKKDSDLSIDVILDDSPTAVNAIADSGYSRYRLLGSVKTDGSAEFINFVQSDEDFKWVDVVDEGAAAPISTVRTKYTLDVPIHRKVEAIFNVEFKSDDDTDDVYLEVSSLYTTDAAVALESGRPNIGVGYFAEPSSKTYDYGVGGAAGTGTGEGTAQQFRAVTDTSARVGIRSSSDNIKDFEIGTVGWEDLGLHDAQVTDISVVSPVPSGFTAPTLYYAASKKGSFEPGDVGAQPDAQWLYDGPGGGDYLGVDIAGDFQNAYIILSTCSVYQDGVAVPQQLTSTISVREGAGASVTDEFDAEPPVRLAPEAITIDAQNNRTTAPGIFTGKQPRDARESEWGMFIGSDFALAHPWMQSATLLVLPVDTAIFTHAGANLGEQNKDWAWPNAGATLEYSTPGAPDTDQTFNSPTNRFLDHTEDYLVFGNGRVEGSANNYALRWTYLMDSGTDIFNVRTDSTYPVTSTRTGKGFQYHTSGVLADSFIGLPFVVREVQAGSVDWGMKINAWENPDVADQIRFAQGFILRTAMLNKFTSMEDTSAVLVDSDVKAASAFSVNIVSDGTPIVIGFSTSVHMKDGSVRFLLYRDATLLTTDAARHFEISGPTTIPGGEGTNPTTVGEGDTDNYTLPYSLLWVDDSPPVGTLTYSIQYRRGTIGAANNSMFNCRDNGSDGFKGTMFAFENKYATENY